MTVGKIAHKRVNITLPEHTLRLLDDVAPKGHRSRVLAEAVDLYVREVGRHQLRHRVKQGALKRAARDRQLAVEWFPVEEELCRKKAGDR